jgi:hypothetical protein
MATKGGKGRALANWRGLEKDGSDEVAVMRGLNDAACLREIRHFPSSSEPVTILF